MDTTEFDAKIERLEIQIEASRAELEPICQRFIESTKSFAVDWCKRKIEESVKEHPEVITAMGSQGVAEFKAKLREFYERLPESVETKLSADTYWPHRAGHKPYPLVLDWPNSYNNYRGSRTIERHRIELLDRAIQSSLEELRPLLVAHKLAWHHTGLSEFFGGNSAENDGIYPWSRDMKNTALEYATLYSTEFRPEQEELIKVKAAKLQAQASDLWNAE